jgi:hypothetical protein
MPITVTATEFDTKNGKLCCQVCALFGQHKQLPSQSNAISLCQCAGAAGFLIKNSNSLFLCALYYISLLFINYLFTYLLFTVALPEVVPRTVGIQQPVQTSSTRIPPPRRLRSPTMSKVTEHSHLRMMPTTIVSPIINMTSASPRLYIQLWMPRPPCDTASTRLPPSPQLPPQQPIVETSLTALIALRTQRS